MLLLEPDLGYNDKLYMFSAFQMPSRTGTCRETRPEKYLSNLLLSCNSTMRRPLPEPGLQPLLAQPMLLLLDGAEIVRLPT